MENRVGISLLIVLDTDQSHPGNSDSGQYWSYGGLMFIGTGFRFVVIIYESEKNILKG